MNKSYGVDSSNLSHNHLFLSFLLSLNFTFTVLWPDVLLWEEVRDSFPFGYLPCLEPFFELAFEDLPLF